MKIFVDGKGEFEADTVKYDGEHLVTDREYVGVVRNFCVENDMSEKCCNTCNHLKHKEWMREPECELGLGVNGVLFTSSDSYGGGRLVITRPDKFFCSEYWRIRK